MQQSTKLTLIRNLLIANGWQVQVGEDMIFVSTNNLVGTCTMCSIIDIKEKKVTLESHDSWNHVSWKSIDPIRGCIRDFQILSTRLY